MKNLIWIILGIGIIGLIIYSNQLPCSGLNQAIVTGTLNSDGKCCSGLVAKAPNGFTGGAWCVEPSDKVECLQLREIIAGGNEGIYKISSDGKMFPLKQTQCPKPSLPSLTRASCNSAGGQWTECGNRCEIEKRTDIACPQVCEPLCLCGGYAGFNCPSGYTCATPSGIADAMGYCTELKRIA